MNAENIAVNLDFNEIINSTFYLSFSVRSFNEWPAGCWHCSTAHVSRV